MKKLLSTLAILTASFSLATAGDYSAKAPVAPAPVAGCTAFDPGFEMSAYLAGELPSGGSDAIGAGIGFAYFFTENIGIDTNYAAFNSDPAVHHFITADLVLRFPIKSACIAPYVFGGGGVVANSSTETLWRIGAGVDYRPAALGNIGLFADGSYNWIGGNISDTTIVRLGVRLPF
ncbi:MAG: porin family protein [Verrucomicrobiales bacterium]|nr:porin family protein [Verrucomicrobiales bacterium]